MNRLEATARDMGWGFVRNVITECKRQGTYRKLLKSLNRMRSNRGRGSNRKLALNRSRRAV